MVVVLWWGEGVKGGVGGVAKCSIESTHHAEGLVNPKVLALLKGY
jgi:hypothetical protein